MRKYLSTIHQRSDTHKKNFAFAVSGGTTLMIFAIWTMVNFGNGGVMAQGNQQPTTNNPQLATNNSQLVAEVSPLQSIGASVSSTFDAIGRAWGEMKNSFGGVSDFDLNASYEEMKGKTINTYGGQ